MKALIFAAGRGNRLKPLTDTTPKALVPVDGKPMLEHVILKLKAAGFDRIAINIHHLGQQIIDFLRANDNFGVEIYLSDEREYLLDTGGGIKHAEPFLNGNEPFLVHNVDIFSNVDLQRLYQHHIENKALATLLVSQRKGHGALHRRRGGGHRRRIPLLAAQHHCHGQKQRLSGRLGLVDGQVLDYPVLSLHLCADQHPSLRISRPETARRRQTRNIGASRPVGQGKLNSSFIILHSSLQ